VTGARARAPRAARVLVAAGSAGAAAAAVHAAVNAALLRRPPADGPRRPARRVSLLLPVRDEAHRVEPCLRSLLAQDVAEVVVLDDESGDGTAEVVRAAAGGDPRVRLLSGTAPPPGWLGKPHACQRLADAADPRSDVLVFVDADVVLRPGAVGAAGATLDNPGPEPGPRRCPCWTATASTWSRPTRRRWPAARASGWCSRCCSGRG
jgi:Glycosyl transferase family 2